ncbi:DUF6270 domain-containing protein [Intrasporangium calvum]|uniref:Uncharacterized protein n=1 Tax=Intrasporangium calvum (strain ATCC 23552 / DSM 43043 / JCM 3097 / NBRC 12989 / NCIMB 10167 / NRRL B-3866 / 7 KIP) TaxID=710696 RepID=E6SEQ9_INTC7|nr:hypothetical protein Intca_1147 [Intrasporangium calvum DSM 43043]
MRSEEPRSIHTFLYGSCVSRDTFEFLRPLGYTLVDYVARQSLISAFGPPAGGHVDHSGLSSSFQRRMLAGDEDSSLPQSLRKHAATTDLLLLDLVDERLGVLPRATGFWTDSVERRHLRREAAPDRIRLEMGSDRHRQLFASAARRLGELLEDLSLRQCTALLAPAWADRVRGGGDGEAPKSFGLSGANMNPVFGEYVDILAETCGLDVLGANIPVASEPDHRWGVAPFHYDDETYAALAQEIERFCVNVGLEPRSQTVGPAVVSLRRQDSPSVVTLRQSASAELTGSSKLAGQGPGPRR